MIETPLTAIEGTTECSTVGQASRVSHCAFSVTPVWMDGQMPGGVDGAGSTLIFLPAISGGQHNTLYKTHSTLLQPAATDSLLPTFRIFQCRVCI